MNEKAQKIKDIGFHGKLACIYYQEAGIVEIKLFGCRLLHIHFPPDIRPQFSFLDSHKPKA